MERWQSLSGPARPVLKLHTAIIHCIRELERGPIVAEIARRKGVRPKEVNIIRKGCRPPRVNTFLLHRVCCLKTFLSNKDLETFSGWHNRLLSFTRQ